DEEKNRLFRNSLDKLLPSSLRLPVVELSGTDPEKQVNSVTREERKQLVYLLKHLPVEGLRLGPMNGAIITAGGISTKELKPSTMESKIVSGLFFAGEIIDADGYTGGFNLQIAFSTGYSAGCGAAEYCGVWTE
ncbi:MAG: NAD(P)/FAD-dependent oxidoreductase, partial [Oscillospiraceae bacterium]|nr:NAD(P)/FAD-dependent oxidoreductase [Oscillospiraceae bacterium]